MINEVFMAEDLKEKNSSVEVVEVRSSAEAEAPDRRPSPFAYHEGMTTEIEHYKKNGVEKLSAIFEKKLIGADDRAILSLFGDYGYLSSHLCWLAFEKEVREVEESCIKNRLNELFRLGLVTRFRLKYIDGSGKRRALSYTYCLSEKGNKLASTESYEKPDVTDVIHRMAFNQYYLSMSRRYRCLYTHRYSYSTDRTTPDSLLVFPSNGRALSFNVITARTDPRWKESMVQTLEKFTDDKNAAFIILTESEMTSLEVDAFIRGDSRFAGFVILYMCDYATFDETLLLKNLIMVNNSDAGTYSTVSVTVEE